MRIVMIGSGRSTHAIGRARAVGGRGHAVRLVTLGEVLAHADVEVRTQPLPRSLTEAAVAARRFRNDVRSFQPDLVHLHYAGGRLGTMATLVGDYPLAVTVMGGDVLWQQHARPLARLDQRATRRILERADVLFAKSEALRAAIEERAARAGRIVTVRWGVDSRTYRADPPAAEAWRTRLGLEGQRVILSPRILRPLYNIDKIVRAMTIVRGRIPDAVLLVTEYLADAEYRDSIVRQMRSSGLQQHVRFIGTVPPSEMPGLYTLAEVVVSVPASDGLPQSLFEAMACERPTVLADHDAYREIVKEGESALFAEANPASLADAIAKLLEHEALARRLGKNARARVKDVADLSRQLDIVEHEYERVLQKPRRRRPWRPAAALLDIASLALRNGLGAD